MQKKSPLSKKEIAEYKKVLVQRRAEILGSVDRLQDEALNRSRQDASGDLSNIPVHMADVASDAFEQDMTLGLIESEQHEVREINLAMNRIEEGNYGLCEECEGAIPKSRLKAIPHARLCLKCKEKAESNEAEEP